MSSDSEKAAAAASYLAAMAKELREIADRHGLTALSYIFGLAEADAKIASGERPALPKGWGRSERPLQLLATLPKGIVEQFDLAFELVLCGNADCGENPGLYLQ